MGLQKIPCVRQGIAALLCLLILLWTVICQGSFEPIPKESAAKYHIDFARLYFTSPEAERSARARLDALLKEMEFLKGRVASAADNLLKAVQLLDKIQMEFRRHYDYLYLRWAVNTRDEASYEVASDLSARVTAQTDFLQQEVMRLDEQTLAKFVAQVPALKPYRYAIESYRRFAPHTLSLKEEEMLSALTPLLTDWPYSLYQKLVARNALGAVEPKVMTSPADNPARIAAETTFKKRLAGYVSQRDLYAFTLTELVKAGNKRAQLQHFEDATDAVYYSRYLKKAEVKELLERVASQANLLKRYQRALAASVKKAAGYSDVNIWDLSVPPAKLQIPRFTIAQASKIIHEALSPVGADFTREMDRLLDPANGRLDIAPGDNRKSGGFSRGFAGSPSVFYTASFEGFYRDIRVLTHEATHAVHRQLMTNSGALPVYAEGPHYIFESFAIFSELLMTDYLYRHESDPLRKRYFLEQFLGGKGLEIFFAAHDTAIEQAVYDGVQQGTVKNADDLDVLTKRIDSQYSIWSDKHDELKTQWMSLGLMYEDPLYYVNYLYAALLSLKYYEMYNRNPGDFAPRYLALMRNGFDAPPTELVKKFLGIDLNDPRLVSDGIALLEGKVKLLEEMGSN